MSVALFDLDGTLTDPKLGITRSVQYALRAHGIVVDDLDSLVPFIGPPLRESFVQLGIAEDRVTAAIASYREYYAPTGLFENSVYPGIVECLSELHGDGWRLAVATSKPTYFAEIILDHFDLSHFFEVVAGSEFDESRVHKHEVIAHALASLRTTGAIMIGDREHDVYGAQRTGLSVIGVTWGYGGHAELAAAGADRIIDTVVELPAALRDLAK